MREIIKISIFNRLPASITSIKKIIHSEIRYYSFPFSFSEDSYNISDILDESDSDSDTEENSEDSSLNTLALLRKYNFRECYVDLKRVDFKGCEIVCPEYDSDDSINR